MVSNIIKGIKQIKIKMQENEYIKRIDDIRNKEMAIYGTYVNIK